MISATYSSTILLPSTVLMVYVSRASTQYVFMIKPREWDLVHPLCSAGSSPKTSRSRASLPTSAGRSPLSLLLLLSLLVWMSSLLLLLLSWMPPKSSLPRETDGVGGLPSAPPPPGPGSRFYRWRLARCSWHRGPHLRHVEVGLAVQICHTPSALLTKRTLPTRALPRCRLPLFGNRGQLLRGRGRGRGYVLPGDSPGGQYGAAGDEHSHAVTGGSTLGLTY